jgi:hypothetical protein
MPLQRKRVDQYVSPSEEEGTLQQQAESDTPAPTTDQRIREEIASLSAAGRQELTAKWQELFQSPAPPSLSTSLLRRGAIYQLQVLAYGDLVPSHKRKLQEAARSDPAKITPRLRPGARLVREWNGIAHTVDVVDGGFRYQDRIYVSLTAIAQEITGVHWSGPRFFGMRGRA